MAIYIHTCKRCGHEWASKNPHPTFCAGCKTYTWDRTYNLKTGPKPKKHAGKGVRYA